MNIRKVSVRKIAGQKPADKSDKTINKCKDYAFLI